ncbi:hypothetical protein PAXRUDRAFT_835485 [Paxillus rubicundulus Ve08.2h10]|uniref:Uncharacterized protein n=1 Tax=Paxillus rubicundulus Ve08.2h10 TaxID=930991 RepID=A0A0D0BXZ8_9AGAM|nr:hypothetical protein PAXRUDRAFT_835485 [Paxillus rubicundulus Ve08.2h10]
MATKHTTPDFSGRFWPLLLWYPSFAAIPIAKHIPYWFPGAGFKSPSLSTTLLSLM